MNILFGTRNEGKLDELKKLFFDTQINFLSLNDLGRSEVADESGETLEENAKIKADFYSHIAGIDTLADDSGLLVDSLKGEPGVYSARYGGKTNDFDRNVYLLEKLKGVKNRDAHFKAVLTLRSSKFGTVTTTGTLEGVISEKQVGKNGFGYDPIFVPHGETKTLAVLGSGIKNRISHRAKAAEAMKRKLKELLI